MEEKTCYGEARVWQPELSGSTINQYATYLVEVELGEETFKSRKRYSDFEWLRAAISACFPGVRVPALPKKHGASSALLSKTGFVDEAFIEARRVGLEDFLHAILQRKQLCVDSQILKRFLGTTSEYDLDVLKKKIDSVSVSSKNKKFAEIFGHMKDLELPEDDGVMTARRFLLGQISQLHELSDGLREVVDAQKAMTKAVSGAQTKFAALSHSENGCVLFAGAGPEKVARGELVVGLRQQRDALEAAPAMHYDMLLAAIDREVLEAEAMQEALESVDALEKDVQDKKRHVETMGQTMKDILAGGEIPSTGTGVARMLGIAAKKSREERIEEMKEDYMNKQTDVTTLEEFYKLARIVLVCNEIENYFKELVSGHRVIKDTFAGLSKKSADCLRGAWEGDSFPSAAGGYPAIPETPDLEYE